MSSWCNLKHIFAAYSVSIKQVRKIMSETYIYRL